VSFEKRIHSRNIFYKEIKMKWLKLRNIGILKKKKSEPNPIGIMKKHCSQNTTIL
jgi:hypothetical protein